MQQNKLNQEETGNGSILRSFEEEDLKQLLGNKGFPAYRSKQILSWLWEKGESDVDKWTDLPKDLRAWIKDSFIIDSLRLTNSLQSQDGTIKFTFALADEPNIEIESVLIPSRDGKRSTLCVSSQAGCAIGCTFCATGTLGLLRNLKWYHILEQFVQVQKATGKRITNVVFMGMGEPMQNLKNVITAIQKMHNYFDLGYRHITVSTVGIPKGIIKLADELPKVRLALSLHSAIQSKREQIIPLAQAISLDQIVDALKYYQGRHGRWITYEYVLLPGFNDTKEDVSALVEMGTEVPAKVNIIPFNPFPKAPFRAPTQKEIYRFATMLKKKYPYPVTVRMSRGKDISGACGQLALLHKKSLDSHNNDKA
ncbi:MAG: 23S rRNA (adenine(2503)-C(2))-methyltransferase RlmN [Chlorobi bacterium]|nr:23S rRNA (adenine(2503)-C(2))-methyltransferase RlmN [Chlorobiota bacterium]